MFPPLSCYAFYATSHLIPINAYPTAGTLTLISTVAATDSGSPSIGPIAKEDVQRSLRDVIFGHIHSRVSATAEVDLGFSIRSIFHLALDLFSQNAGLGWIPFGLFRREHESLLKTPRFLTLVVGYGFWRIVQLVLHRVHCSPWTIQERRYVTKVCVQCF